MNFKKVLTLIIGLIFLLFATLQYNDPDPWAWIFIYGLIALLSLLSAFGIYSKWIAYIVLAISLFWMILLLPGLWQWLRYEPLDALLYGMSPDKMYIEESREFLGLLMGAAGVYFVIKQNARKD